MYALPAACTERRAVRWERLRRGGDGSGWSASRERSYIVILVSEHGRARAARAGSMHVGEREPCGHEPLWSHTCLRRAANVSTPAATRDVHSFRRWRRATWWTRVGPAKAAARTEAAAAAAAAAAAGDTAWSELVVLGPACGCVRSVIVTSCGRACCRCLRLRLHAPSHAASCSPAPVPLSDHLLVRGVHSADAEKRSLHRLSLIYFRMAVDTLSSGDTLPA